MNKKVLTISIVLVLAIAMIAGFLVWKNQCDEKVEQSGNNSNGVSEESGKVGVDQNGIRLPDHDDWKRAKWITYRDEESGFEFQYPDSHFISEAYQNDEYQEGDFRIRHADSVRYLNELNHPLAPEMNYVEVRVRQKDESISLKEWFITTEQYLKAKESQVPGASDKYLFDDYEIEGEKVLMVEESSMMSNDAIYFDLGGKVVEFQVQGISIDFSDGDNFFVEMLKTFEEVE